MNPSRRLPIGAEALPGGGVSFRVWAPGRCRVDVVLEDETNAVTLAAGLDSYFEGHLANAGHGTQYRFRLDGCDLLPDPASRFQPKGPFGPSQVIDPNRFAWQDSQWPGPSVGGQVIYELHIGTFTREGTWHGAERVLPDLAALGITVIEIMPVADFPGRFGWGYDGVNMFAPTRLYGTPDDFRHFVNEAHRLGLGVILDVVFNHIGPSGNFLGAFAADYFTDRHPNDWGQPLNFDGPNSGPVREFFLANAAYWISEFHLDGFRFDATDQMRDDSSTHILSDIGRRARSAAGTRSTLLIAENEPQQFQLIRIPERGGYGLDAVWNDDFHHAARVAMTGQNEAYCSGFRGTPQEFISTVKWGSLFQGQFSSWHGRARGSPGLDLAPWQFVNFLQNHDQIANTGRGLRCHQLTSPGRYRALTALLLLAPGTPLLFQGQEFGTSSPFLFFADHEPGLAAVVRVGRRNFMSRFPSLAQADTLAYIPDLADAGTFERCKLDWGEKQRHAEHFALHKDLLRLRRESSVFSNPRPRAVDGAVLADRAFVLRYFAEDGLDRLLLVNLGHGLDLKGVPEPLLAPPHDSTWNVVWSSSDIRYGGGGTPPCTTREGLHMPPEAAIVLTV